MDDLKNVSKGIRELVSTLKMQFDRLASDIAGHLNDTLSPEMALVKDTVSDSLSAVKNSGIGVYKLFTGSFSTEKLMLKETKTHTRLMDNTIAAIENNDGYDKFLQAMNTQNKIGKATLGLGKEQKRERMKGLKGLTKGHGILDWLFLPIMAAAFLLGGLIKKILIPFQLLWTALKGIGIGLGITKLFAPFKGLSLVKLIPGVEGLLSFFSGIGKFFKSLPLVGRLSGIFRLGMKFLGWPLFILTSLWDGVSAWRKTEGSFWEKSKAAIKAILIGWLEVPALLLGNLYHQIDPTKTSEEHEGEIKKSINNFMDGLFKFIDNQIKGIHKTFENLVADEKSPEELAQMKKDLGTMSTWLSDFDKWVNNLAPIKAMQSTKWTDLNTSLLSFEKWVGDISFDIFGTVSDNVKKWWAVLSGLPLRFSDFLSDKISAVKRWTTDTFGITKEFQPELGGPSRPSTKQDIDESVKVWKEMNRNLERIAKSNEDLLKQKPETSTAVAINSGGGSSLNDIPVENSKGIAGLNFSVSYGGDR